MNISGLVDNIEFQEPAGYIGATSLSYVVRVEGKQYFMKQLRPEYASELRYRAAFYKEQRPIAQKRIFFMAVPRVYQSLSSINRGRYCTSFHYTTFFDKKQEENR